MGHKCDIRDKAGKFLCVCNTSGMACLVCEFRPLIATRITYWMDGQLHRLKGDNITSQVDEILMYERVGRAKVVSRVYR